MFSRFAKASEARPRERESWDQRIFLSFDFDWAHDEVLEHTIELVERAGVAATWYVTHDTPLLQRLRRNPRFELGLHPNFLPSLMERAHDRAPADEILGRLLDIVPEATAIRSHSLVHSCRLAELYRQSGLTHDGNMFIPAESGIALRPWIDHAGMVRVPFGWQDNFWCMDPAAPWPLELLGPNGLHGFTFHPIHVFLNTDRIERYEQAREAFQEPARLVRHRNTVRCGVRDLLVELMALAIDAETGMAPPSRQCASIDA